MTTDYAPLSLKPLAHPARLADLAGPERVSLDAPAESVMTDLREVRAGSVAPEQSVVEAQAAMAGRGVRLLFVLDDQRDIVGVLTMTDLAGEKVVRFMQSRGLARGEVTVADMMTPARELQAVSLAQVKGMRVGHVVATLKATGRQHITVADGNRVCGVFSTQRIARQLGIDFDAFTVAGTFSEIEAALAR
jgi:CBS domain-containing protein